MTSVCISNVIRYKTDTHVFAINKIAINYKYIFFFTIPVPFLYNICFTE